MERIIKKLGMAAAMLLPFLSASAYDFEVDGIYYNVISHTESTCSVTNGGVKKSKGDLTIPSKVSYKNKTLSVMYIEAEAFKNCNGLTAITIPNCITEIRSSTFKNCTRLASITIPNSVTAIAEQAFYGCSNLTSITIPNSITELCSGVFFGCTSLTSITIPNSVTVIGTSAFSGCTGLTSITIPNSVKTINSYAFSGCTSLTSITIPNSVEYLSGFYCCSGLTSISIPKSVKTIGRYAFSKCTGITSITIPNSVKAIGHCAFLECTGLTSITIPNSVTKIDSWAFYRCTSLYSVELPASLEEISTDDNACFKGCENIKKLVILGDEDDSFFTFSGWLTYSDYLAVLLPFSELNLEELYLGRMVRYKNLPETPKYSMKLPYFKDTLKKITFGKKIEDIIGETNRSYNLYNNISSIPTTAEIYCENPTPPSGAEYFTDQQYISNVVYVPWEALEAYKQAEGWKNFWDIRPYDPASGIKDVSADDVRADVYKIYNLSGMLVKETADKTEAYDLPAGIYIINGRKVAIR